jgi:hypothetical protein
MRTTTRRPLIAASIALGVISTSLALASPALAASESTSTIPAPPAVTQTGEQLLNCAGGFSFRVTWEPVEDASLYRLVYVYDMTDGTQRTESEYTGKHTKTYVITKASSDVAAASTATLFAIGAEGESQGTVVDLVSEPTCSGDAGAGQLVSCDDDPDFDASTSDSECLYRLPGGELYIDYIAGETVSPAGGVAPSYSIADLAAGFMLFSIFTLPARIFAMVVAFGAAYVALVAVLIGRHHRRTSTAAPLG